MSGNSLRGPFVVIAAAFLQSDPMVLNHPIHVVGNHWIWLIFSNITFVYCDNELLCLNIYFIIQYFYGWKVPSDAKCVEQVSFLLWSYNMYGHWPLIVTHDSLVGQLFSVFSILYDFSNCQKIKFWVNPTLLYLWFIYICDTIYGDHWLPFKVPHRSFPFCVA